MYECECLCMCASIVCVCVCECVSTRVWRSVRVFFLWCLRDSNHARRCIHLWLVSAYGQMIRWLILRCIHSQMSGDVSKITVFPTCWPLWLGDLLTWKLQQRFVWRLGSPRPRLHILDWDLPIPLRILLFIYILLILILDRHANSQCCRVDNDSKVKIAFLLEGLQGYLWATMN